jgi:hypothetical protein
VRRPRPSYFVCVSPEPVVPDSDDFDFDVLLFFAPFFVVDAFALCFAPEVDPVSLPVALAPVADDSEPEAPVPVASDEPLEPIDPDEPLAVEDFFDVFLCCLWCFAFVPLLVPASLLPCMPDVELPCVPVVEPWLPCSDAELCASAAPASITAAATAIHFMSNIRSSARLLLDRDAELRPARNIAGRRNHGFAPGERQGVAPCR